MSELLVLFAKLTVVPSVLAVPAWIVAWHRRYFSIWEVALIPSAVLIWVVVVEMARPHQKTISNFIEPIGIAALAVVLIYWKDFLLVRFVPSKRSSVAWIFAACTLCAAASALLVPPLPE